MARAHGNGNQTGVVLPEVGRRTFLGAAVVAAVPVLDQHAGTLLSLQHGMPLRVVSGGQARADVVVSPEADEQALYAADVLVEYVERATGAVLPTVQDDNHDGRTKLFVGLLPEDSNLPSGLLPSLADDGFVIHRQDETITIIGPTSWGTRYGVYEFLERHVDVRWLTASAWPGFPDLDGSDVPETSDITVECPVTTVQEAAFAERSISPITISRLRGLAWDYDFAQEAENAPAPALPEIAMSWGRPNRVRHQIEYNHNMWALVPPEKYGDPDSPHYRPEFYGIDDGQTFDPPSIASGWNPYFTAPGIAEVVATEAIALADDAGSTTVSLAVNDGGVESYNDEEIKPDVINRFGMPSASEAYYGFVRQVAHIVAGERPELKLGVLAYSLVADPPSEPLPPNVMPFLSHETYSWLDPVNRARDDAWLQDWKQAAQEIGWWDYAWGPPHSLPRLALAHTADAYQHLVDNGAASLVAQANLPLGEGPLVWIMSRLLWDPDQNVDLLLDEWCRRFAGDQAAPYLESYFQHWDQFWTERVPGSEWFDTAGPIFTSLPNSANYLDLVTPAEITQSRAWLENARSRTQTAEQQERMDALLAHWEFYEASALSFPRRTTPPANATEAMALLTDTTNALDASIGYAATRQAMAEQLYEGLQDRTPERYDLVWDGWNLYALWDIAQYIKEQEPDGGPVRTQAQELMQATSENVRDFARMTLAIANGNTTSAGRNMSFEDETLAPAWNASSHPKPDEVVPSTEHAADGEQSMFVPGNSRGPISQVVDARPGFFRYSAKLYAPDGLHDSEEDPAVRPPYGYYVTLRVRVLAADNTNLGEFHRDFSIKHAAGTWHEMVLTNFLVEGSDRALCWIIPRNNPPIWVDDVSVTQIGSDDSIWPDDQLWELVDYLRANEPDGGPVTDALESEDSELARTVLGIAQGTLASLTTNTSFEEGSAIDVPGWHLWGQPRPTRTTDIAHTGSASIAAGGFEGGGVQATFRASAGLMAIEAHILAQPAGDWSGEMDVVINAEDADGNRLQSIPSAPVPLTTGNGEWYAVRIVDRVPDLPGLAQVRLNVRIKNVVDDPTVYIDDVAAFQPLSA